MKPAKSNTSYFREHPILAILLVAILPRVVISILYGHATIYPDSEGYIDLAKRLVDFNLNGYEGQRSPGYPLLLAIANLSITLTLILQSVIGIINLYLIYRLRILLNISKKLSTILTIGIGLYIPAIFFEFAILSETLTLLFVSLLFYLTAKILKSDKPQNKRYFSLALVITFLVLIKPFYIFVAPLIFILLYCEKKRTSKLLPTLILSVIVFLGWSTVNLTNTGHFTSTTFYGFNLAQNCVHFAENTTNEYKDIGETYARYREANDTTDLEVAMTIWQAYPELQVQTGLSFPDLSKKLFDYSIATIKKNPIAYAKQVFISWKDFWKTSLYWEYDQFAVEGSNVVLKYIAYAQRVLLQLIKIAFILLTPICIIRYIRRREISFQLIAIVIILSASLLQALMTYGTNSRFSFPFEMIMVICVVLELQLRLLKQKS